MLKNRSNYKLFFYEKAEFIYIKMSKNKNNKSKTQQNETYCNTIENTNSNKVSCFGI